MTSAHKPNTSDQTYRLDPDRAIYHPDEDILDRGGFVRALTDAIKGWRGEKDSLVLGLYGQWGSGKTSIKNLIRYDLERTDTPIHIVEFNPWQWSSQEQIAEAFFREIGFTFELEQEDANSEERAQRWWEYTARLGLIGSEVAAELLLPPMAAKIVAKVSQVAVDEIENVDTGKKIIEARSLEDTRKDVIGMLSKMPNPLLVIIDDIDRLTPPEMKLVFQLVKSNADFPNLIYLLLFEKSVVGKSLEVGDDKIPLDMGYKYLEKIINISFDVPIVEQEIIDKFIGEKIGHWLGEGKISNSERRRFINLYWGTLQHFFQNLRDAKRFLSTFYFHMGLFEIRNDITINPVDMFALETLRVFESDAYKLIPSKKARLTRISRSINDFERREIDEAVDEICSKANGINRKTVRAIIEDVFPRAESHRNKGVLVASSYSHTFATTWRANFRVCHPAMFDRYFLLRLASGDVSPRDINQILEVASDGRLLLEKLHSLKNSGDILSTMYQLEDRLDAIPLSSAVPFVSAFFDIGDDLSGEHSMNLLSPVLRAGRIIYQYLKRKNLPQEETGNLILEAAKRAQGGVYLIVTQAQDNDRNDPNNASESSDSFLIDEENNIKLKRLAVERIREAAKSGFLLKIPQLPYFLYRWKTWSEEEDLKKKEFEREGPERSEPKKWLQKLLLDDGNVGRVLVAFLNRQTSMRVGENVERVHWKFNLKHIEEYVSADELESCVDRMEQYRAGTQIELTRMEEIAIDRFRKVLKRKREGKPYGLDEFWRDDEDD